MAWNKYYIIVKNPATIDFAGIIKNLNLGNPTAASEVSLLETNKPDCLYIGKHGNFLLIVHPDIPFDFFAETPTPTEQAFLQVFSGSDMAILIENSTVDSFGYAVFQNGEKVRMKEGGDGEIYNDVGDLLPEEKEILAGKVFEDDEIEEMKEGEGLSDKDIEERIQFEASWRVPGAIAQSFFGMSVDDLADSGFKLTKFV